MPIHNSKQWQTLYTKNCEFTGETVSLRYSYKKWALKKSIFRMKLRPYIRRTSLLFYFTYMLAFIYEYFKSDFENPL